MGWWQTADYVEINPISAGMTGCGGLVSVLPGTMTATATGVPASSMPVERHLFVSSHLRTVPGLYFCFTDMKKAHLAMSLLLYGAPGTIRTCDRLVRSPFGYSDSYPKPKQNKHLYPVTISFPTSCTPVRGAFSWDCETNLVHQFQRQQVRVPVTPELTPDFRNFRG